MHLASAGTRRTVVCVGLLAAALLAIRPAAAQTDSVVKVWLVDGALNGVAVSGASPQVDVVVGGSITGTYRVTTHNGMDPRAFAPVAATPTWGDPQSSYWGVAPQVPVGYSTVEVEVNLTAPLQAGTYYIATALGGTYDYAQIVSGTHPAGPADWAGGNKLSLRPASDFELAMQQGWIPYDYYLPPEYVRGTLGLAAIRVKAVPTEPVPEPGILPVIGFGAVVMCRRPRLRIHR